MIIIVIFEIYKCQIVYYILIYHTNHMIFIVKELIYQFNDYLSFDFQRNLLYINFINSAIINIII